MAKTVIHKNNLPFLGSEELLTIAGSKTFSDVIFELLSGNPPNQNESKMFELVLNLSIDHGQGTPSAIEVVKSAKDGKTISESVALGILQINDIHGGAIEPAMELFYKIKNEDLNIQVMVEEYVNSHKRIPGFGHRIYSIDPRTQLIFETVKKLNNVTDFIDIANSISAELKSKKEQDLPVNIDGAIAVVLCSFGWPKELGKAVFIIARTPGLCGQFLNNSK